MDIDQEKIKKLQDGKIPIYEPGLEELMELSTENLQFISSYDEALISEVDAIVQ